ncbi:MAG: TylF/MycF/NovP-related O-methyltransferase [bacterium]
MALSLFQLVNYVLILCLLILLARFLWMLFFHAFNQPAGWRQARKNREVPKELLRLERSYPDKVRFYTWWFQIERLKKDNIPGSFAELGVYKGESARIIHRMDPSRKFFLFDTFEGFTLTDLNVETGEAATYTTRHFADTSLANVMKKIDGNDNIHILKGYFPDSAEPVTGEKFALVNLDADLYNPTKAGLEFFYPRMSQGGIILIHDYNPKWPGVVKAVDDFLSFCNIAPVIFPDRDGTILILKA